MIKNPFKRIDRTKVKYFKCGNCNLQCVAISKYNEVKMVLLLLLLVLLLLLLLMIMLFKSVSYALVTMN